MKGVFAAEWLKIGRRKLGWVLAAISVFLSALGTALTLLLGDLLAGSGEFAPPAPAKPEAYTTALQTAAGNTWVPIILTTVVVAAEYQRGTWAISLTWNPHRVAHLVAKGIVLTAFSTAVVVVTAAVSLALTALLADGSGFLGFADLAAATLKILLVQVAWVGLSLLGAVLFRSAALAVGLTLGFSLAEQILGFLPWYRRISLNNAVVGLFGEFDLSGLLPIYVPDPPVAAMILTGWALLGLALAAVVAVWRDA